MPEAIANQVSIHYQITGSGPPLLFLHGLGSSGRDWENQVEQSSEDNTVITIDFRGHGRSAKPPGPYSIPLFASDVSGVLDEIDIGPVAVVGISLGGMVAFQLAADHPDLVEKLVAVNALQVFELETVGQKIQVQLRKMILRFIGMRKMGEVLAGRLFPDEDMVEERATLIERWAENDKDAYRDAFQAILDWEGVREQMASFEKPMLVVASDGDYVAVEAKQPFVDLMPAAQMVVIENAHHAVPVERPERFNEVLDEFLSS
jgi:pimeloyl-ACP methyl ester carboxylesterase